MKPSDLKSGTYIDFGIENIEKNPKFEARDHVRISKYKHIFLQKVTLQIGLEEFLLLKKLKNCFVDICY